MTALTDSELIERSISEPEQFVAIFDRHFSVVHRFLRLRGDGVADDLAAETFAIAFGRRSEYDAARPDARAWLFGIAVNLLRTHWRSERRKLAAFARLGGETAIDSSYAVIERMDARRAVASLRGVLDTLRPDDRDILLLHACVGLTYDEVADALAIPSGTVRSRLHRLRARLRDRLAEEERQRMETCG